MKTTIKSIVAAALCAVGLSAFAEEPASNEIWYTATAKLAEVTGTGTTAGLHKEVFEDADGKTLTMTSHTWEETTGKGVITFDGGIATVGGNAFNGCKVLSSITIPASVTSIGNSAFSGCYDFSTKTGLTTVTFAEGSKLETIGEQAFYNCQALSSITIPASVTSIGNGAFKQCYALESISVDANNTVYSSPDNCNAIIETATHKLIQGCKNTVIPESVEIIGENAFWMIDTLESITIPASVTNIGNSAFYMCCEIMKRTGLTTVTFAEGSKLETIGESAFKCCLSLSSPITIPASVTSIGNNAFDQCSKLTEVTFAEDSKLVTIGEYAFGTCSALSSITIPASVTSIEKSAFSGCSKLTEVTFAEVSQLGTIGESAFYNCKALSSITIPASVTSIGKSAFQNCTGLTDLVVKATAVPTLANANALPSSNEGFKVYVPSGKGADYQAANNWSVVSDKIFEAYMVDVKPTAHGAVAVSKDCFPTNEYTTASETVTVTATPDEGYLFKSLAWNDGTDHDITEAKSFTMPLKSVTVTAVFEEAAKPEISAVSAAAELDLTPGDRVARDEETLVVNPAWGGVKTATVQIDGEEKARTYDCASNDLWTAKALEPGRYGMELEAGTHPGAAGFWKVGADWIVLEGSNFAADVTLEGGRTYLVFGTNTIGGTLTAAADSLFLYDEGAPAGFKGEIAELPKMYRLDEVDGLKRIIAKTPGCEDNPWKVGKDGTEVVAWTNGSELVVGGKGTVDALASIKGWGGIAFGIGAVKVTDASVTNVAAGAFTGIAGAKVTLPDGWRGEFPEEGVWYGATDIEMASWPLTVQGVKFLQRYPWNGKVDIDVDVTGTGLVKLSVSATIDGKPVTAKTVEGGVVDCGESGGRVKGVRLTWNALADLEPGFKSEHVRIKVTAAKGE